MLPTLSTSCGLVLIALILGAVWPVDRTTAADVAADVAATAPANGSAVVIRRSKRYLDFLPLSRMFVGINEHAFCVKLGACILTENAMLLLRGTLRCAAVPGEHQRQRAQVEQSVGASLRLPGELCD